MPLYQTIQTPQDATIGIWRIEESIGDPSKKSASQPLAAKSCSKHHESASTKRMVGYQSFGQAASFQTKNPPKLSMILMENLLSSKILAIFPSRIPNNLQQLFFILKCLWVLI